MFYNKSKIELYNIDCLPFMKQCKDEQFDLAIIDPPYFKDLEKPKSFYGKKAVSSTGVKRSNFKNFDNWDVPDNEYFNELFRISKNQIIWGCNYYADKIPHIGRIVWDKVNDLSPFSKAEIASKSMNISTDMFRFMWNGMLQNDMKNKEIRIHPTQKPVKLYEWLLINYAKKGDKILDTHLGSGSIAIACHNLYFDLTACEIDKDYFDSAKKRINQHKQQQTLF